MDSVVMLQKKIDLLKGTKTSLEVFVVVDYEIDFCLMLSRWLKNLLWILQYPL
jgi:hypothetical protein